MQSDSRRRKSESAVDLGPVSIFRRRQNSAPRRGGGFAYRPAWTWPGNSGDRTLWGHPRLARDKHRQVTATICRRCLIKQQRWIARVMRWTPSLPFAGCPTLLADWRHLITIVIPVMRSATATSGLSALSPRRRDCRQCRRWFVIPGYSLPAIIGVPVATTRLLVALNPVVWADEKTRRIKRGRPFLRGRSGERHHRAWYWHGVPPSAGRMLSRRVKFPRQKRAAVPLTLRPKGRTRSGWAGRRHRRVATGPTLSLPTIRLVPRHRNVAPPTPGGDAVRVPANTALPPASPAGEPAALHLGGCQAGEGWKLFTAER